ncbi:MAG: LysR substrate-binding domain-containing protein [Alphaproteobacteria bacterium]|nr:LysR substrate-binding domain-containing protein [Alphaproteobacteria bacterium]
MRAKSRLGVPHDIVGPYLPPVLRRFDRAWPRVRVSLKCTTTPQLLDLLRSGSIDLTLTTEQRCGPAGKTMLEDDLIWAGASNGTAQQREPLPVLLGDEKCAFRQAVLEALSAAGRDWRPVCEVSSMEPLLASLEADLAVAPLLRTTIPDYLRVIERDRRLPRLPKFFINMYLPPARPSDIAVELARHIAQEFEANAYDDRRKRAPAAWAPAPRRFRSRKSVAPGDMVSKRRRNRWSGRIEPARRWASSADVILKLLAAVYRLRQAMLQERRNLFAIDYPSAACGASTDSGDTGHDGGSHR